ncbi:Eco57I restriction-modification methylase domain-containing protein [Candidatus Poriferisocius sp.]|uniref:Eco57I restriction-modification methylase domain-containing protein n=1 Tax=Candidatus Poriferisocius sp. TaxID=3101276 RepID=UPI003B014F3E
MNEAVSELEKQRLVIQDELDSQRDNTVRNYMGQFATPTTLAIDIQRFAKKHLDENEEIHFIDPAIGTGSFYSALMQVFIQSNIITAVGYEIDPYYGEPALKLWGETGLDIRLEDFTHANISEADKKFNLLICNPPYVRHHHISSVEKQRLKLRTQDACGVTISGLAGLYCYFLGLSHKWMADGALAGWLIPSEFMDVNYGTSIKQYLLEKVTLLHVHRFDPNDIQFCDALVSSSIVWIRNQPPRTGHKVRFTYGGSLEQPKLERLVSVESLHCDPKWTGYPMKESYEVKKGLVLSDLFKIKRGLVTGGNDYFILPIHEIARRELPMEAFKPILPSPRYVPTDEVKEDRDGQLILERRLFLLDPPWKEQEIRKHYPKLWDYLEEGKAKGIADRYLCQHRTPWYAQEYRPPAPFVCTYLGRNDKKDGRPFRFILNNSEATAANVYLMLYPKGNLKHALKTQPDLKRQVWKFLNEICPQMMLGEGRVYGGGLHKLEPRELGNVPAGSIAELLPESARPQKERQSQLFGEPAA